MSHVNPYKRMTLSEEDFNNQLYRMNCVDINYPFLKPILSLPSGLMSKVPMEAGMEIMHRLINM